MICKWGEANHIYFQFANLFLSLTFFAPNTLKGLLWVRIVLAIAGLFFILWATEIICSPDTLAWNTVFLVVNFGHASYLLHKMRRVTFDDDNELIYTTLFKPLGIERWQYAPLAKMSAVKELPDHYILENNDEFLYVITKGSARAEKNGELLYRLHDYEFINSIEWIITTQPGSRMLHVTRQVSLISECCIVVQWDQKRLLKKLKENVFLKNGFDSIIVRDVTNKLFQPESTLIKKHSVENNKVCSKILYTKSDERQPLIHEDESLNYDVVEITNLTYNSYDGINKSFEKDFKHGTS